MHLSELFFQICDSVLQLSSVQDLSVQNCTCMLNFGRKVLERRVIIWLVIGWEGLFSADDALFVISHDGRPKKNMISDAITSVTKLNHHRG